MHTDIYTLTEVEGIVLIFHTREFRLSRIFEAERTLESLEILCILFIAYIYHYHHNYSKLFAFRRVAMTSSQRMPESSTSNTLMTPIPFPAFSSERCSGSIFASTQACLKYPIQSAHCLHLSPD